MQKNFQVTFIPENIIVKVPEGVTVLMAAAEAGIGLESPCGGRGTCGKCAVRVISGEYGRCTDSHLSGEMSAQGYVLACRTRVEADLVVEIPAFSRLSRHKVLLDSMECQAEADLEDAAEGWDGTGFSKALCRRMTVRLEKPELEDNRSDLDRLKACLAREHGVQQVEIGMEALRKLPAALREGQWEVTLVLACTGERPRIIRVMPGPLKRPVFGVAVEIGTTTVAVSLAELETGKALDKAGTYNRQSAYGSDVISRIIYTEENTDGLQQLQEAAVSTVNSLIGELLQKNGLTPEDIVLAVCAGNTVMSHLFFGLTPTWLRLEPYIPAALDFPEMKASEVGLVILPEAPVLLLPSVASYVGGDITAGVLSTRISRSERLTLFIDIGTNGELVLGNQEWLVTCACSAGPAFEGSGIRCGMRAMDGAIDRLEIDPVTLIPTCRTIGDGIPLGICGSGLIQALSEMKEAGIIDRAGKIPARDDCSRIRSGSEGMEYLLVPAEESEDRQDIVITESDIKNLLRAKGAIFAGIRTMLRLVELDIEAIERVYIAGGFGNYINITDAIRIGLLPDLPAEKYKYVGNSSLHGAEAVLHSRKALKEIKEIAGRMTYLELSTGTSFMDEFISALFLPHTDLGLFPSVEG